MLISRRVGLTSLLVAGIAAFSKASFAAPPVAQSNGYAIGGYDVVAYFAKNAAVRGKPEFSHVWHGATWLFESAENRDKFAANPDAFAPQYGGYCAVGMSKGGKGNGDPQAWSVRNGKLYLTANQNVRAKFDQDGDTYISKADSWWQRSYAK
jgi:YHS domain-containing protein